ncbi:MAG: hypothetical protein WAT79_10640 [Saprospiraceae bacterium]
MKLISSLLFIIIMPFATIGQDLCKGYFAHEEGSKWIMTTYDKNKKKSGSISYEVLFNEVEAGENIITFTYEGKDEDDEEMYKGDFTGTCSNHTFTSSFSGLFGDAMPKTADVEVEISGDFVQYPHTLKPGESLPDANIVIASKIEGGMTLLKVTSEISNRKVVGFEKIVTPAGTFDCVKITYDAKIKMVISKTVQVVEYMAQGIGIVRSEHYNKKGDLSGYSELSMWSKG